ncbi:MAG: hypothetical protein PHP21_04635, partial [Patescibacteria group bacterium]|nr:hypothetical protein [Patescibacteria group bacterium]
MVNKIAKICDYLQETILLGIIFLVPVYFAFTQENYNVFELNKAVIFRVLLTIAFLAFTAKVFIPHLSAVYQAPLKGAGFIGGIGPWRSFRKPFILLVLFGLSVFIS